MNQEIPNQFVPESKLSAQQSEISSSESNQERQASRFPWKNIVILLVVISGIYYLRTNYSHLAELESLAQKESDLKGYLTTSPGLMYGGAFLLYVVVTGLSLPAAAVLTLVYGWVFGFWAGVLMVSFASTLGACCSFLFSRYLFRDGIQQRFGNRLKSFNKSLEEEGPFYLFSLRLVPVVPFFVINIVMGLTPIKLRTFYWVSQLGMLAGTMAFVYAGASVSSLNEIALAAKEGSLFSVVMSPQLVSAFVVLGILPFAIKKIVPLFRKKLA